MEHLPELNIYIELISFLIFYTCSVTCNCNACNVTHVILNNNLIRLMCNTYHLTNCKKIYVTLLNRKYDEALEYHRQSLVLLPHSASSLSAMGYVYALKGLFHESVTCFHKVQFFALLICLTLQQPSIGTEIED